MRILKYLIIPVIVVFTFSGGCELSEEGTLEWFDVEYDYMYSYPGDNYDCLPKGSIPVFKAFKPGNVDAEIWTDEQLDCNTWPADKKQLVEVLYRNYEQKYPWYLEGGMAAEPNAERITDDVSKVMGITIYVGTAGPYHRFALIFGVLIKNSFLDEDMKDVLTQTSIHELGHEYADLSDKYLHPEDHDQNPEMCCVMDALKDALGNYRKCMNFCIACIDSIKKSTGESNKEVICYCFYLLVH